MESGSLNINSAVSWRELNGIIYLTIIFNEILKENWVDRLSKSKKTILIREEVKSILLFSGFKTNKPAIYEIAVIKDLSDGSFDRKRISTKEVVDNALSLGFNFLEPEIACIAVEKISYKDLLSMGIDSLTFIHQPINDSLGNPKLLAIGIGNHCDGCYHDMIYETEYEPCGGWFGGPSFSFLVSKNYL